MAIDPSSHELTHGGVLAGALTEAMLANEANTAADTQPMYAMTDDNASALLIEVGGITQMSKEINRVLKQKC
ncbi:hypothetical protein N9D23_13850 [Rubripirellula sp.]|nr:hypothetical protein [Rubripirellula sp.]